MYYCKTRAPKSLEMQLAAGQRGAARSWGQRTGKNPPLASISHVRAWKTQRQHLPEGKQSCENEASSWKKTEEAGNEASHR